MKYKLFFASLLMVVLFIAPNLSAKNTKTITVLASPSLSFAISELSREYVVENNIAISSIFGSTDELMSVIDQGDSADILISEDRHIIQELKQKGVANVASQKTLVKNNIVIAVNNNYTEYEILKDQKAEEILENNKIIIDSSDSTLGILTWKLLQKIKNSWNENHFLKTSSAHFILRFLKRNNDHVALIYESDAINNENVRIIKKIPTRLYNEVVYSGIIIAGENMQEADEFLNFISTYRAKKIFSLYGFKDYKLKTEN